MGSRPLAALMLQHPKFKGPMDFQREALTLQNLMQVNKLRGAQIDRLNLGNQGEQRRQQAKQRATAQEQKDKSIYLELFMREKDEEKALELFLDAGGSMQFYSTTKNALLKDRKDRAALSESELKNFTTRNQIRGQVAQSILNLPPEQRAQAWPRAYQHLIQSGAAPADQLSQEYPGDKFIEFHAAVSLSNAKQYDRARQEQQDAINDPGRAADADLKVFKQIAQNMGPARDQKRWDLGRNFLKARWKKTGVSPDYLDLIPEDYSPEAVRQVKQLAIAPSGPRAQRQGRPPSRAGKALAERTKQRAIQKANDAYRKNIAAMDRDWQRDGDTWNNFKSGGQMSDQEYQALRQQYKGQRDDDIEFAEDSYASQLESLGFTPEAPISPSIRSNRQPAGAQAGTVKMRSPNGQISEVPKDQVEHFLAKGATIVR